MNSRLSRALLSLLLASGLTGFVVAGPPLFSGGPIDGVAGEPPTYANCADCHIGLLPNAGPGQISVTGFPTNYTPGATYSLTIELEDPSQRRWGFELVILDENKEDSLGTVTLTDNRTQQSLSQGRVYVKHTSFGSQAGTQGPVSWNLDWTAPAVGAGAARLYIAGNAANNDRDIFGDNIYTQAYLAFEDGSAHPELSVTLQPDLARIVPGTELVTRAHVRNHSNTTQTVALVTRVKLQNGKKVPASGYLHGPEAITLAPGEVHTSVIRDSVPANTPTLSASYEAFIGTAGPKTLVHQDVMGFSVF